MYLSKHLVTLFVVTLLTLLPGMSALSAPIEGARPIFEPLFLVNPEQGIVAGPKDDPSLVDYAPSFMSGTSDGPVDSSDQGATLRGGNATGPEPAPPGALLADSPGVGLTKSGSPPIVEPGGTVTYTIQVTNSASEAAPDVVVTDAVPAHTSYVTGSMSLHPGTTSEQPVSIDAGSVLTWTIASLTDTNPMTLTFAASVTVPLTDDIQIENTAWVSAGAVITPSATVQATVNSTSTLHMEKSVTPEVVEGGQDLTYTIVVTNDGTGIAADVVVTDLVPVYTSYVDDSMSAPSGVTRTEPATPGAGSVLRWDVSSVADEAITLTFQTSVDGPITDGVTIENTAWLNGETQATVQATVNSTSTLHMKKSVTPEVVEGGQDLTYTIVVTNDGTGIAADVVVTDLVPVYTSYVDDSMSAPSGVTRTEPATPGAGSVLRWDVSSVADEAITLTFQTSVDGPITDGVTIENTAWLNGETQATVQATVNSTPTLQVSKQVWPGRVEPQGTVTYVISLSNTGTGIASDVDVFDTLADDNAGNRVVYGGTVAGYETPDNLVPLLIWYDLSVRLTYTLAFTATVPEDQGIYSNTITVNYGEETIGPVRMAPVEVANPDVSLSKTASSATVQPGGTINYTIDVDLDGPGSASAVVTDAVPVHTTYVAGSMSEPSGVTRTEPATQGPGSVMTWTIPSFNEKVSLGFEAKVDSPPLMNGTLIPNTAWLDTGSSAGFTVTVESSPNVTVSKTVYPSQVEPGGTVVYTITLNNSGSGIATGVSVTDDLPSGATYAQMVSGGPDPSLSSPDLVWASLTVTDSRSLAFMVSMTRTEGTYPNVVTAAYGSEIRTTGPTAGVQVVETLIPVFLPLLLKAGGGCTADQYEPNNTWDDAYPLTGNTTLSANFCESSNRDLYKFTLESLGTSIVVNLTGIPSGCDYDLYLYHDSDPNNSVAKSQGTGNSNEHISYSPTQTGLYEVQVYAYGKGALASTQSYQLQVAFQ